MDHPAATRRVIPALLAALSLATAQADVPVPQPTFTTPQLYQPLRTFTSEEIGILPTFAGMHRGYLVIAGGRNGSSDPAGYARMTVWRLSQSASPTVVNPSVVGTHLNDAIFKSHVMGFSGEMCQVRAGKFSIYDLTNPAAPVRTVQAGGGRSSSHSSCWAGKYIYTGGEGYGTASGWIDIYDVGNPASPVLVRSVDIPTLTGFRCASVYVLGNVLVVSASLTNGIATFDLSDPTNPLLISVFRGDTGANTYTSYLSGHRLYGGGQAGGLYIYDIQNPEAIQLVDRVTTLGGTPRYPVVQDEFVHLANLGNGKYQKVRVDTVPAQVVADVLMPPPPGDTRARTEIAIPIGNMVFVGNINGSNPGTPVTNTAGWLIPHDTAPDTRPPVINAVRPVDGEINVSSTAMIGVSFTDMLDTPTISNTSVIVRPVGGSALTGTYSNMGGIVNFTPTSPLIANTTYEIVVPIGGVKDTQGNAVTTETISRFSTGSNVDTTAAGLVLHYPLNETSGTLADDAQGSNDGTLTGYSTSAWSAGLVGRGALGFDGVDDYVLTPSLNVGNSFSFSTWLRIPSGSTNLQTIVGNCGGGFQTAGFKVFVYGSAHATTPGRIQLETGNGTAGNAAATAINIMPFDQWVHLGIAVNRSTGTARIYVNGVDRSIDTTIQNDFPTTAALTLGRMGTTSTYFMPGHLDDFRLYNRVLNAADFEQLRYLCDSPVAHWRFNSSTANSAPNGSAVTLSGTGATYNTTQSSEGAASLNLDGTSGYATSTSMELGSSFTIAAWVRTTSGTNTLETITSNSNAGLNTAGWRLYATGSTHTTPGRVGFETGNGTAGIQLQTVNGVLPYDTWAHVAVVADRVRGLARIYVNGVDRTPTGTARTDFTTVGAIQIGRMANNTNLFHGQIDDLRVHPRWLTENEIGVLAVGKLLAHWRFEGSGGDESGFGRTATLLNGAGYSTEHTRGLESLNLDGIANGTDDHATTAAFDLGNQFSLSLWSRVTSNALGSRTILANATGGGMGNGLRFFINSWGGNDGRILFETGNGTVGNPAGTNLGVFQFNQWNHLAVVVDRTAGTAEIYYNRRLVTTDNGIRNDFANNLGLYIGRLISGGNFHGQLDDLRIYAKKLTGTDIGVLGAGSPNTAPAVTNLASTASAATTGTSLTYTATANDPNLGDELFYRFDFGDGTTTSWTNNATTVHAYNTPGRYTVTVHVSDGNGTNATRTMTQIVYNALTTNPPSISAEMAYDSSRNKVWVVVPDGNDHDANTGTAAQGTVVRFDASSYSVNNRIALGANSEPVALAIRPGNAEVWVANKSAGNVSVINADTGAILTTINTGRGSLPVGVAFSPDGTAAFVACEGLEGVLKYNPATRAQTGAVDTGSAPRGLAVTADSTRVLISRFRSPDARGEIWEYTPASIVLTGNATPVRTFAINRDTTTADTPSSARGVANYLSQVVISPDGQKAWIPAKKDNISRGQFRDGQPLNHENTVRSLIAQLSLVTNAELNTNRIDLDNVGFTVAGCFSPRGDLYFAAAIGNELVAVIDANSRNALPAVSTRDDTGPLFGHAPSGLCVSPDGSKLYVHNFLERKVRVFNISSLTAGTDTTVPQLATVTLTTTEPMTASVLNGKRLFYNSEDPRLASEGYIGCASCHLGGDQDGRTWDLTQFGEGLRNTIDLRGHGGMAHGALHWSANFNEIQDFENQIRDLSGGSGLIVGTPNAPLGAANAGRSTDLDALAAYVSSLTTFHLSPYRNQNGTLTLGATSGASHFTSKGCATCHSGTAMTDSNATTFPLHNVGTQNTSSGQRLGGTLNGIDTPTLRALWSTPPYLHRGQAATIPDIFNTTNAPGTTNHARFRELNATQQGELLDYLEELE